MKQVSQHYTHTFEILRFYFQFQSEPTFDPSDEFVDSCTFYILSVVLKLVLFSAAGVSEYNWSLVV